MRIAVDAMGGDLAPRAAVQGALLAALEEDVSILLVGDREIVEDEIEKLGASPESVEVVHAPETVGMDEPATAVRRKRRSSLAVCAELVRDGRAAAMVTAGNSGAAMVAAKLLIGAVPGVDRPALAAVFPNRRGRTVVLDVGANVDSRAEHLRQFAVMGHYYAREVIGTSRPRIGLLSIGEEHVKGNDLVRDAHAALAATGLNFVGNVEGGDVFSGSVDVVVCDGFVGNVLLKSTEGMAELVVGMVREELLRNSRTRFGGWLARPAFANFARRTDYAEYGAVPLLGVAGGCFIGHGRSNARAVRNAVRRAVEFGRADVAARIRAKLAELAAAGGPLAADAGA
ncbi:MAG: phosphate acyltransferase PlsX [Thermoanaerobaculia bacterium]|nr:MAG: phosphate acyltransferase PlsX [Thermoanaerobaculia bacterium]MBZ0103649.1 phosphate acyltransferase PlsX [Thermoanaerobaculia bacterium]